jgi:putative NIF3 family GTP cyclohydrolase 1 type 2
MKAVNLYEQLEKDFIFPYLYDGFAEYMPDMHPYMTDNFKERSMGLVCDFTNEINQVFTAVFLSDKVMENIFANNIDNAMLFLHHPVGWEFRGTSQRFFQIDNKWVEKCREHKISIYAIHVPLDNYSPYSTSKSLADAIGLDIIKPFSEYRGGLAGVIGKTACRTVGELQEVFTSAVEHQTKLYPYGDEIIRNGLVAVVAGGGNDMEVLPEVYAENINTFVTGLSVLNEFSVEVHQFERENKINVMGGTHYSTEKFACQNMCMYFRKLGLPARFVDDVPVFEDL